MKTKFSKTMRVSAVVAALLASHQCGWAFDNIDDVLSHLQETIISQNYVSGPWSYQGTSVPSVYYSNQYDNNNGVGEIVGDSVDKLVFKNFIIPGLNVDATLTEGEQWNTKYYFLNLDLSKTYKLATGYKKNKYTPAYEGKYARIMPTYSYDSYTAADCGVKTIDDKSWAYIIPTKDTIDKITFSLDPYSGSIGVLRDDRTSVEKNRGFIVAIYEDEECTQLVDARTVVQGQIIIDSGYKANATAEDYDEDGYLIRQYRMNYSVDGHSYKFFNLNGKGMPCTFNGTNASPITLNWDWDNEEVSHRGYTIDASVINNTSDFKFEGLKEIEGITAYWFSYTTPNRTSLTRVSEAKNTHSGNGSVADNLEVFGFYGADKYTIDHNHTKTSCPWVTNDGDRKTGSNEVDFFLYDYGLNYYANSNGTDKYSQEKGNITYYEKYSKTNIYGLDLGDYKYVSDTFDCTLDVALSIDQFGSNADNIYVSGTITPNANTDFVDHYELCVKPGTSKTVNDFADGYKSDPNGFVGSTNISSSSYDFSYDAESNSANNVRSFRVESSDADSEEASESISFSKLIPKSALTSKGTSNDDYSFYVKAVYKSEYIKDNATDPGLNPTFHDIQSSGITTGIESVVEGGSDVAIYGVDGAIEVFGEVSNVDVYSISGAQVYSGSEKTIAVSAGLYIVKAGKAVAKVVVK
jgi:hypothetical protein